MFDFLLNILTLGIKPLYERNLSYYKIIREFREKLPRPQNEARRITDEEKRRNPFLYDLQYFTVVDLGSQKTSIVEADIDIFYNKLNSFDYSFMFFKPYYRKYIKNLNRFNPKAEHSNFDLFMVTQILKDDPLRPLKPLSVLVHHMKWEYKLTSKLYKKLFRARKK